MPKMRKEEDLQAIYDYIKLYLDERNLPPTQREIAEATFVSRSTLTRYLDILAERGLIVREDGLARGIWIPKQDANQGDCDEDEDQDHNPKSEDR